MTTFELLSIELTILVGTISIAAMGIKGWVKQSTIDRLEALQKTLDEKFNRENEKLWKEISKVNVLEAKIENIEAGIQEIKQLLQKQ